MIDLTDEKDKSNSLLYLEKKQEPWSGVMEWIGHFKPRLKIIATYTTPSNIYIYIYTSIYIYIQILIYIYKYI